MRIIEKKCPNCRANLSFEVGYKEAKCNYCGQTYIIENDKEDIKNSIPADFTLMQKKILKSFSFTHFVVTLFIFLIVSTMIITISINVFKQTKGTADTKIEYIDDTIADLVHTSSIDIIKSWNVISINKSVEYEPVGMYLYKGTFNDVISDVIKCTYVYNGVTTDVYSVVNYSNVEYKEGTITMNYKGNLDTNKILLSDDVFSYVYGYRNLEELYNKAILSKSKGKVQVKGNVYKAN